VYDHTVDGISITISFTKEEYRQLKAAREAEGLKSTAKLIRKRFGLNPQYISPQYEWETDFEEIDSMRRLTAYVKELANKTAGRTEALQADVSRLGTQTRNLNEKLRRMFPALNMDLKDIPSARHSTSTSREVDPAFQDFLNQ